MIVGDKEKATAAMKKAGELEATALTAGDKNAAWNQKKLAMDLCSDSFVPYDEMLRAYMDGYKAVQNSKH